MYTLAPARPADIAVCYAIIEGARTFQREQGFVQWTDDYPNETTIAEDIRNAVGYLFLADREIAGYLCVDFAGEPAYAQIAGEWHTGTPYAVIHRMAFDARYRGRGLSTVALHLVEALCLAGMSAPSASTPISTTGACSIFCTKPAISPAVPSFFRAVSDRPTTKSCGGRSIRCFPQSNRRQTMCPALPCIETNQTGPADISPGRFSYVG